MFKRKKKEAEASEELTEDYKEKSSVNSKVDVSHSGIDVLFIKQDEVTPELKKEKKSLGIIPLDKIKYTILVDKGVKLPKKYTFKFMALNIYDILMQSSVRGYHYCKRNKELLLFNIRGDSVHIETFSIEADEVAIEVENYFAGNPYIELDATEKQLASQYQESQAVVLAILLVVLVVFGYFAYGMMFDEEVVFTEKTPPPMPTVKPLDPYENNILLNKISTDALGKIVEEIDKFKDREAFNIRRISSIQMSKITPLPALKPQLDARTNTWKYTPEQERQKRGGYEAKIDITYQQKFPSNGYRLETEGSEDKIALYTKQESFSVKVYSSHLEDENTTGKILDRTCLDETLRVVDHIIPSAQREQYIDFKLKRTLPVYFYRDINALFSGCPLELKSFTVKGGEFTADMNMFKLHKEKSEAVKN